MSKEKIIFVSGAHPTIAPAFDVILKGFSKIDMDMYIYADHLIQQVMDDGDISIIFINRTTRELLFKVLSKDSLRNKMSLFEKNKRIVVA
jgi:hypothetical protein